MIETTLEADNLFAGDFPVADSGRTIAAGQDLKRGTVLGEKTADSQCLKVDSAASDGTQAPTCILAEDVDTTDGAKEAPVYLTGEYSEAALIFGGTDTIDDHRAALRGLDIITAVNVPA